MKTKYLSMMPCWLLVALQPAVAQDVPVDVQTLNEIIGFRGEMNGTELHNKLAQMLEQAKFQVERLDKQLARTGDYDAPNIAGITNGMNAITTASSAASDTSLKTTAEMGALRDAARGKDVFTTTLEGVFKAIGETFTTKDGKETKRDETRYTTDAKALVNLKEYTRIHDTAVLKQQDLKLARLDVLEEILTAPDEVASQKLKATLDTINTELITVGQDIANASVDLQNQERAMALQSSVDAKARSESMTAERGRRLTASEIQSALNLLPNSGKTGAQDKDYRLPFKPPAGSEPTEPETTE